MTTVKRLNQCTFDEAAQLWNEGFSGYDVNVTMSVDALTHRFGLEGLSPSHSVAAFADDQPAGVVLSGIKMIHGQKVAWNGGTGVAPQFRKQGIGKILMQATMDVYREENVDVATLEVLTHNTGAVKLYESLGYVKEGLLQTLQKEDALTADFFKHAANGAYQLRYGAPSDVRDVPFYNHSVPWASMWQNITNGLSLIVLDENGETVGYALFKRAFNRGEGKRDLIFLYQCEVNPQRQDAEAIIRFTLAHVFAPYEFAGLRTAGDFVSGHERVAQVLLESGFETKNERYLMNKRMKEE